MPKLKRIAGKKKPKVDLLPCPFCGSRAESQVLKFGEFEQYEVRCTSIKCFVDIRSYRSMKDAVRKWNSRFNPLWS
jgi:hypothetical protein